MRRRFWRPLLVAMIGVVGAVILLALSVYPFQYSVRESAMLAGGFVLFALVEFVLDDSTI